VIFARLTRGDWVAALAALGLLLVMAMDWYSTEAGVEARKDEKLIQPRGATAGEVSRALDESARIAAEEAEENAWQADPWPDRVILIALIAAAALAIAAAWLRAANVRFRPPWTPSALAAGFGLAAALLLAARIVQKPSVDVGAVVQLGAPLGLVCVGTIVLGARAAWNAERDGSAWGEGPANDGQDDVDHFADTDEHEVVAKPPPLFDHEEPASAAEAPTATAVRPVVADQPATAVPDDEYDEAWAPGWSDPAAPAEREPEAEPPRRRRQSGKAGRGGKQARSSGRRGKGRRGR
jgi:hypothetical protein